MEFKHLLTLVEQFQVASDQPVSKTPTNAIANQNFLRYQLMREENKEYMVATQNLDKIEVLDACTDMLYILLGTINQHGLQDVIEEAFTRVHVNNMTKIGPDGKVIRNAEGKILKPTWFKNVDLTDLIK